MKNKAYWQNRAIDRESKIDKLSQKELNEIKKIYDSSQRELQSMINDIYAKYSDKSGLDVSELKKLMSYSETDKFWKSLEGQKMQKYVMNNYKSRITRLEALKAQLQAKCNNLADKQEQIMAIAGRNAIKSSFYKTVYDTSIGVNADLGFATLDDRTIDLILKEKWLGSNYSDRVWKNTDQLAVKLKGILTKTVMTGQSQAKATRELRDAMNVEWYKAERLVRTEMNHFHNQAELDAYKEMGVEEYIYVATLDNRTSEICQELDGKKFKLSEAEEGVNYPPMHPFCRSAVRAYVDKDQERDLKRRARDPNTGQTSVIGNKTYSEWMSDLNNQGDPFSSNDSVLAVSFSAFKNTLKNNWNEIAKIKKNTDKSEVIKLLDDLGFEDSYHVGNVNKNLVNGSNKVLLTKSNLAYLLSRHAQEYSDSGILMKMKDVLKSDIILKGKSGKEGDLIFYKLFKNEDGSIYGLELKMNRINKHTDEYVVHYLQVREKKALKLHDKYLKKTNR